MIFPHEKIRRKNYNFGKYQEFKEMMIMMVDDVAQLNQEQAAVANLLP
jgi:hypothetical protein